MGGCQDLPSVGCTQKQRHSRDYLKLSADLYKSRCVNAIQQETTTYYQFTTGPRRQRLEAVTDGLGLGMHVVQLWIEGTRSEAWHGHFAEPHLSPNELCHTLALEIGSPAFQ